MVGGGRGATMCSIPEILGQTDSVWAKTPIFNRYLLVIALAVTPSKKVQLTLIGSPHQLFNEHEHLMLPLPPILLKNAMAVFPLKVHFSARKSATKFLCVKTVSDKVVSVRSDWNSRGTYGGTSCCRGKKHIFLHCDASNVVLKILQHD